MNRRTLIKQLGLSLPAFAWGAPNLSVMKPLKAQKLSPGDTIGLVTPASGTSDEQLAKAVEHIKSLGLKPVFGKNAKARNGFLAGTDRERLEDLHRFFADPGIQGIWCIRGGYGSARLLAQLDYRLIRKNPKVFIGYSDITALLNSIYKHAGLISFHGPVATSDFSPFTLKHLKNTLMEGQAKITLQADPAEKHLIHPGQGTGVLLGGNLSLVAALCGTDYLPKFKNKIVLLEEVGEKPYRVDRLLTQVLQSTDLSKAAGIALGIFKNCEAKAADHSFSLQETLQDRLGALSIPVLYGFPFGHITDHATLPIGGTAQLDTQAGTLTILESPVGN